MRDFGPRSYRGLIALGLALLAWVLLQPRGVSVEVVGKDWRRVVEIEREVLEMHAEPCAAMPAGARLLGRTWHDGTEHCRFQAPVWRTRRRAAAEGTHPARPAWPALQLADGERSGPRHEEQAVQFADRDARRWACRLPLAEWLAWQPGQRTRLAVHRFNGTADCASLARP